MQKQAFKIMGALLVLVLAVSFSVGAVSATAITLYDGNINIVSGTYFPSDAPAETAELIPFATDLGALALASTAPYGNYGYAASDGQYSIASLGDIEPYYVEEEDMYYCWNVFVNGNYSGDGIYGVQNLLNVNANDVVTACFVADTSANTDYTTALTSAQYIIRVTVTSVSAAPTSIFNGNVTLTTGTFTKVGLDGTTYTFNNLTGIGALNAASIVGGFTYNVTGYIYEGTQYTWVVDIDGVTGDWSKIGYGWGIYKDGVITESVENVPVASDNTLNFYCCASKYSGTNAALTQDTAGNYLSSSLYTLQISIV